MRLDVGLDAKAVGEAAAAILAKSGDTMPALLVSVDAEKSKVLAYAGAWCEVHAAGLSCVLKV